MGAPGFRRFWAAATASSFGAYTTGTVLGVLVVVDLGGTASEVGLVQAAHVAPYVVIGLLAGVLADRVRRKLLLAVTDVVRAVLLALIPLLAWFGVLDLSVLLVAAALIGAVTVVNAAAQQSLLPRLVEPERLHRANVRIQQSDAAAQTTGPALAGGVAAAVGAPVALLGTAVSYLVAAGFVLGTPVSDPPAAARGSVLSEIREGARWVYRHATLRPLALSTHAWFVFNGVFGAVVVPFALLELRIGAAGLGIATACAGVGALLGGFASERLGRWAGLCGGVAASRVLEGVGIAVVASAALVDGVPALVVVAAGQLVFGFGMGAENPIEMSYRQSVTPDALQGRMNATMRTVNRSAVVVGAPLGGVAADGIGFAPALLIAATGVAVAGAGLGPSGFRTARAEDRPPAPG